MKKTYIAPEALVECHFAEIMQMTVDSVGLKGGVKDQDDTGTEEGEEE